MDKKLVTIIAAFFLGMAFLNLSGCSASKSASGESVGTQNSDSSTYQELADYLRRIPGVRVSGSGQNVQVLVRGTSTFGSDNRPLYVVGGQVRGTDYNEVNRSVEISEVRAVRLLTGSDAAAYGMRGANGVIEIDMKR